KEIGPMPLLPYSEAMRKYGNDKPDTRFGMTFVELKGPTAEKDLTAGKGFRIFDEAGLVAGICVEGAAGYTRKQLDELTASVKRPQIGASGMFYARYNADVRLKAAVDHFFDDIELPQWAAAFVSRVGDLLLILAG